ncbi:MAG: hypothetical protein AB1611_19600 [bacterium]
MGASITPLPLEGGVWVGVMVIFHLPHREKEHGEHLPAIIIAKVKDLCQRLEFLGIKVGDARKHPRISPVDIFKSLLLIPILRLKSLNQLDNKLRLPEARDSVRMILKAVVTGSLGSALEI